MWIVTTRVLHGPVTVAAERGGLLIRWLKPNAGSNPAWSSMCLYPNWQRERVESAFSARSSRARHTRFRRPRRLCPISWPAIRLRCYASGEAARLSIERDVFESRTARHFRSVAQPGSVLRSVRPIRRQHWRAARSYKPGQRTAVDGRDRNPGRRPTNNLPVAQRMSATLRRSRT
jgi:hypothetical protein